MSSILASASLLVTCQAAPDVVKAVGPLQQVVCAVSRSSARFAEITLRPLSEILVSLSDVRMNGMHVRTSYLLMSITMLRVK